MFLLKGQGLSTPKAIYFEKMGSGQYWYNGIRNCFKTIFSNLEEPLDISIVVNIDGLPPFRSAFCEF